MSVNLFFDGLSIGELLTFKTGPPCIPQFEKNQIYQFTVCI